MAFVILRYDYCSAIVSPSASGGVGRALRRVGADFHNLIRASRRAPSYNIEKIANIQRRIGKQHAHACAHKRGETLDGAHVCQCAALCVCVAMCVSVRLHVCLDDGGALVRHTARVVRLCPMPPPRVAGVRRARPSTRERLWRGGRAGGRGSCANTTSR